MDPARIAELLAPFLEGDEERRRTVLSPGQLLHISMYIDLLLRWNARINLTSVRQPEEIVTRHFGESFFVACRLFPESAADRAGSASDDEPSPAGSSTSRVHVIDVGSGAGFPGLPIKIWAPHIHLTMIESHQRKATFLREVVRNLDLTSVEVFAGRAEAFAGDRGDVVTLRAVERFESIFAVAHQLVADTGRLAIMVGESQLEIVRELAPSLNWASPVSLPRSDHRVFIIGSGNQDD